jgi:hypothetical protein
MLEEVMKALGRKLPISACATGVSMAALGNSLMLENMLDPVLMPQSDALQIMSNFFDLLTSTPAK